MSEGNKNQWVIWAIVIGAIVVTLIAFNYQGDKKEVIPLSDIFPEEFEEPETVEYEFVGQKEVKPEEINRPVAATSKTAVPVAPAPAPKQSVVMPAKPHNIYTIQALSSKNKEMTEKEAEKLKGKGLPAYVVTIDIENKGTWYRVYVGKFEAKAQAEQYLPKVKELYGDCFVRFLK